MIQKGYQHCDISIGNVVMLDKSFKTKAFEVINLGKDVTANHITKKLKESNIGSSATWENKLVAHSARFGDHRHVPWFHDRW